jgi:hypothetical protein
MTRDHRKRHRADEISCYSKNYRGHGFSNRIDRHFI